jgi:hypothetical protein
VRSREQGTRSKRRREAGSKEQGAGSRRRKEVFMAGRKVNWFLCDDDLVLLIVLVMWVRSRAQGARSRRRKIF